MTESKTVTSDDEPVNAPERVWLAPDLGDDWSILKVGDAIYWEGIDRHHPDDCETEYLRADIAAASIRELQAELEAWRSGNPDYVVVPVEPTLKMQKAGFMAKDRLDSTLPNIIGIYRAMIRAAQPDARPKQGE